MPWVVRLTYSLQGRMTYPPHLFVGSDSFSAASRCVLRRHVVPCSSSPSLCGDPLRHVPPVEQHVTRHTHPRSRHSLLFTEHGARGGTDAEGHVAPVGHGARSQRASASETDRAEVGQYGQEKKNARQGFGASHNACNLQKK